MKHTLINQAKRAGMALAAAVAFAALGIGTAQASGICQRQYHHRECRRSRRWPQL